MIERTNCRGKTNSVALRSQTMNQRARHAFIAPFTRTDRTRPSWVRERETKRNNGGLRDRKIDAGEERESGKWERVKREKRLPEPEIAVSVLAFIHASVADDAALKVSASSLTSALGRNKNETGDEGERGKQRRNLR